MGDCVAVVADMIGESLELQGWIGGKAIVVNLHQLLAKVMQDEFEKEIVETKVSRLFRSYRWMICRSATFHCDSKRDGFVENVKAKKTRRL